MAVVLYSGFGERADFGHDFLGRDRIGAALGERSEVLRRVDPHADDFVELTLMRLLDDEAMAERGEEVLVDFFGDGVNEFWDEGFNLEARGAGDAHGFKSDTGDAAPGDETDGGIGIARNDEEVFALF